jgi:hypothetical protein
MPDRRNGRDTDEPALQVAVPLDRRPQDRVRVVPITVGARAAATELHRALYDMMVEMVPSHNENTERTDATYLQVIVLSRAVNGLADRVGRLAEKLSDTRAKVASSHDLSDASQKVENAADRVAEVADRIDELSEEIHTDHGVHQKRQQTDSERVRAILAQTDDAKDAARWRGQAKTREKIYIGVAIGVLTLILVSALGVAWRVAKAHDDGAAEERARTPVKIVEVPALPIPATAAESPPPMLAAPPASAATVAPRRHQ